MVAQAFMSSRSVLQTEMLAEKKALQVGEEVCLAVNKERHGIFYLWQKTGYIFPLHSVFMLN